MLIFFGEETGKKTQFACLIFHWITCRFVKMIHACMQMSKYHAIVFVSHVHGDIAHIGCECTACL